MKIKTKTLLLSVVPAAVVLALSYIGVGGVVKTCESELDRARFERNRKDMENVFNEHFALTRPPLRETFISLILKLHEWDQLNTFFVRFASLYPHLERIALYSSGRRLAEMSRRPDGDFGKAQVNPDTSLSNIFWVAGKPYVDFVLPAGDGRRIAGTLALEPLIEKAEKHTLTPGGSVKVYSSPPEAAPSSAKDGFTEKKYPLMGGAWTLAVLEEDVPGPYRSFRRGFIIFSIIALGFTFALALSYSNSMSARLEALASGQISPSGGSDEISALEEKLSGFYDIKSKLKKQISSQESAGILGQHAAMIGHEFRNPIAAIKNAQYFISSQIPAALKEGKVGKHLDIIRSEIKQISFMIEDLLSLSRLKPPVYAPCDIGAILSESVEMFRQEYKLIDFELAAKKNLRIQADASEIRQVFSNIIKNACEAITPPGEIRISAEAAKNSVTVKFSDTGCGIPADKMKEVWEPFISTKSSGMGFGLATVKKIIEERHKGTITVKSKEGEGTEITLILRREQS